MPNLWRFRFHTKATTTPTSLLVLAFVCLSTATRGNAFHRHAAPSSRRAIRLSERRSLLRSNLQDSLSSDHEPSAQILSLEPDYSPILLHHHHITRRTAVLTGLFATTATPSLAMARHDPDADAPFTPAQRPTAYRVDSTIPPTLLPLSTTLSQRTVLLNLGKGYGTDKQAIVVDTVNLNNMLNKAVFGSINAVKSLVSGGGGGGDGSGTGTSGGTGKKFPASFVCLGVPTATSPTDVDLVQSLVSILLQPRSPSKKNTALGLFFVPLSAQKDLQDYLQAPNDDAALTALQVALEQSGVSNATFDLYRPLFIFAKQQQLDLLAMAIEPEDLATVRSQGLQNVNPERRSLYVMDPQGFIALPNDPKFKLYTDRSLLKDQPSTSESGSSSRTASFFAERILVHEAAATAVARYAASKEDALVTLVAPIADVRFLRGINGRLPRLYSFFKKSKRIDPMSTNVDSLLVNGGADSSTTDEDANAVTTILLNPTAEETLSKTRYLRLEIGTAPETLDYQTKIADYLWFSSSPKVNMIPRLMDG